MRWDAPRHRRSGTVTMPGDKSEMLMPLNASGGARRGRTVGGGIGRGAWPADVTARCGFDALAVWKSCRPTLA